MQPVRRDVGRADREVPLGHIEPAGRTLSPAVHAWLDGDVTEASVRRTDSARDIDFWKRLNGEVEHLRLMQAPIHVQARIMEALPRAVPTLVTPWWRRELVITPATAIAGLVGAALVTAVAMALALGSR